MKRKGGFTLIELLIVIVCCSLITLGAMTLLLTSARVEKRAEDTISQQQTARMMITMLERLASSGEVKSVETVGGDWMCYGGDDGKTVLLKYEEKNGAFYAGDGGTLLMDGVENATADLNNKGLLSFGFIANGYDYTTSIFCRVGVTKEDTTKEELLSDAGKSLGISGTPDDDENESTPENARLKFLQLLASQVGSTGRIVDDKNPAWNLVWYSQWYRSGLRDNIPNEQVLSKFTSVLGEGDTWTDAVYKMGDWNQDTPWCACFLSWAIWRTQKDSNGAAFAEPLLDYAHVADCRTYFSDGRWQDAGSYVPIPGDIIFFDWEKRNSSTEIDIDHVGAVLYVTDNVIYTIEGNSSGRVNVCGYNRKDPRIVGYGIMNFKNE